MKYFLYIFYRYFSRNKNNKSAYWNAISAVVAPIILYCAALYFYVFPENGVPHRDICFLIGGSALVTVNYFVWKTVNEKQLEKPELADKYQSYHGFLGLLYIIGSIACVFVAGRHANKVEQDLIQTVNKSRPATPEDLQERTFKEPEPETP